MSRLIIILYVLITSAALVTLKFASKAGAPVQFIEGHLNLNINPLTVLGIGLYGASFILYTYLISKFDLGYIIPLTTACVYVLIFAASFIVFNEQFNALKIGGIIFILIGLTLLNLKSA